MRALVIVDLQYDFMPGGALPVPRGDETVAVANRLLPHFNVVAATQDWHPREHASFTQWPVHCVQETRGAALHDELDRSNLTVFRKGTDQAIDSYSGFFDNEKQRATGLDAWLRERWISRIYVMGLATDYCVKATALDACALGFDVWLIEDGCRAVDVERGDGDRALMQLRGAGVHIIESGAIGP
ncbi:MAG: bifunctional nicotinamidase/pyrazinamidase [Acidobacteriota bacterium]